MIFGLNRNKLFKIFACSTFLLYACWLTGQMTRDTNWLFTLFFHIASPIVLAILVALGIWSFFRKKFHLGVMAIGLATVPFVFVALFENNFLLERTVPAGEPPLRLVHWNMCRGKLGWDGATRELKKHEADIYVVSEFSKKVNVTDWANELGTNYVAYETNALAIALRGKISEKKRVFDGQALQIFLVTWDLDGEELDVMIVDLSSDIFMTRGPCLKMFRELLEELQPDIVVGDFNAPRGSCHLSPLPEKYRHAYHIAGEGISYTWPTICPLYAIDQCIIGERIEAFNYELKSSIHSDHRAQILDFTIEPADPVE